MQSLIPCRTTDTPCNVILNKSTKSKKQAAFSNACLPLKIIVRTILPRHQNRRRRRPYLRRHRPCETLQ